ncbi:HNH endonuclease signature motif containing protein [Cellulomonas aerilata]|nr:HNH endonuclease signature motif containing protein [Cellulomonas aerilata]
METSGVAPLAPVDPVTEMDVIARSLERLAGAADEAGHWPSATRRSVLRRLDRAVDGLATVRGAVLVAERDSGAWQGAGDRSFEAWRGRTGRTGLRSAAAQVRQADQLQAVPTVAAAVASGRIRLEHAVAIGKVAGTGTPAQRDAVTSPAGQERLLAMADGMDAGTFATGVTRWAATLDPAALDRDHENQRAQRFLHVARTPAGTFLKGRLDAMAGHRLTLALEALSPRPAADDDRDHGQRCADALDAMAGRILALADSRPGGHVPPQVSMILTADTWIAARAERDRRRARAATTGPEAGVGPSAVDGASPVDARGVPSQIADGGACAPYEPATLEDGTPVPAYELAVAMCDCEITRIVIDADGVPIDLGRSRRVFTGQQRRAVIARDRECAWPHCHAHARWCEVHHIRWWERDTGPTSVDNGVLLCSFHHHEVHRRDLLITRVGVATAEARGKAGADDPSAVHGGSSGGFAPMGYRFRDSEGRVIGGSPPTGPPGTTSSPLAPGSPQPPGRPAPPPVASGTGVTPGQPGTSARDLNPPAGSTRAAGPPPPRAPAAGLTRPGESPPPHSPTVPQPSAGSGGDGATHDGSDLVWTTDPFTGMRVPDFFLVP